MSWREQRRADRLADAKVRREDADSATHARIAERESVAREKRAEEQLRVERRQQRQARRAARVSGLRTWTSAHVVELLIYPLALVSALLTIPAIADYGYAVYGSATGYALFCLTELGMWAFAVAVQLTRRRDPHRPTWALQVGVCLFAAGAFTVNALHGAERGRSAAVVMGLASIAGVVAHQLITAGPRRSRSERVTARISRLEARKLARVRRAAVRQAVSEIDPDGTARLVSAPGRYTLDQRPVRPRLQSAAVPGLAVGDGSDEWDQALADLLTEADRDPRGTDRDLTAASPVATLDRDADQHKSSLNHGRTGGRVGRSIEQLRAELTAAIRARPDSINPHSAESIRKALRCSPTKARQLRNEYRGGRP